MEKLRVGMSVFKVYEEDPPEVHEAVIVRITPEVIVMRDASSEHGDTLTGLAFHCRQRFHPDTVARMARTPLDAAERYVAECRDEVAEAGRTLDLALTLQENTE